MLREELPKIVTEKVPGPKAAALLKKREFHWIQIGGRYRIPKKGFDAWLERQCQ